MSSLVDRIGGCDDAEFLEIKEGLVEKNSLLDTQLDELKKIDYNVERIWTMNTAIGQKSNLDDTKVDQF